MDTTNEITPEDSAVPVYLVPLTATEIAALEQSASAFVLQQELAAQARESAIQKLQSLGLTDAEVSALLNG